MEDQALFGVVGLMALTYLAAGLAELGRTHGSTVERNRLADRLRREVRKALDEQVHQAQRRAEAREEAWYPPEVNLSPRGNDFILQERAISAHENLPVIFRVLRFPARSSRSQELPKRQSLQ